MRFKGEKNLLILLDEVSHLNFSEKLISIRNSYLKRFAEWILFYYCAYKTMSTIYPREEGFVYRPDSVGCCGLVSDSVPASSDGRVSPQCPLNAVCAILLLPFSLSFSFFHLFCKSGGLDAHARFAPLQWRPPKAPL